MLVQAAIKAATLLACYSLSTTSARSFVAKISTGSTQEAFVAPVHLSTPQRRHCLRERHAHLQRAASTVAHSASRSSVYPWTGGRYLSRLYSTEQHESCSPADGKHVERNAQGVTPSTRSGDTATQDPPAERYHENTNDVGGLFLPADVQYPSLISRSDFETVAQVAGAVSFALVFLCVVPSDALAAAGSVDVSMAVAQAGAPVDVGAILGKAGKASFGGGVSGAAAAGVQVLSLMWLRTTMNFQYKNGGSTQQALQTLWDDGGIPRFYRGVSFALVQGPLSRFGDTAANVGVLSLLEAFEETRGLPLPVKSAAGSLVAGLWRIGLTPIDAYKTTLQVSGADGVPILAKKVETNGPGVLFDGALATAAATVIGHYPWDNDSCGTGETTAWKESEQQFPECKQRYFPTQYFTYNSLGAWLPVAPPGEPLLKLGRQAFLGLCSSCVSDCCSNSVRVVKTTKQTAPVPISYPKALKQVVDEDGVAGLFFRGLQTRLLVNALQGALFAVAWKYFEGLFKTGL